MNQHPLKFAELAPQNMSVSRWICPMQNELSEVRNGVTQLCRV
jgi:hypothetical protein